MSTKSEISCLFCFKPVKSNQNGICCDLCKKWTHLKSTPISKRLFLELSYGTNDWYCQVWASELLPYNHYVNEDEFKFEMHSYMVVAYSDTLNQEDLSFSQFDDENSSPLLNSSDLDPDTNFFNSTTNIECRYINPCEMCKNVIDLQPWLLHLTCNLGYYT